MFKGRWGRWAWGAPVVAVLASAFGWVAPPVAHASSSLTSLPSGFGAIAVDGVNDHVFVSSPTSGTISVLDFSGNVVQTITGEPGAGSMTVYGGSLYVALPSAIDVFSTSTLARTATLASGQLTDPGPLVEAGGRLWTSSGACGNWSTQLVSVDPASGAVTGWPTSSSSSLGYCIGLAASPYSPNLVLAWDLGLEPATITEFDVSSGSPVQTASQWESDQGNLKQIAFNPDGSTFVTASGSPYYFDQFGLSNLGLDGVTYPAQPYPNSIATTPAQGGLIVGSSVTGSNQLYAYHPGQPATDLFDPSLPYPVYDQGLALSPDGSEVFAALQGSGSTVLDVLPVGAVPPAATNTTLATSTNPAIAGQQITFTADVTSGTGGVNGTVTFSDGSTPLGTVQLSGGTASYSTSLTVGTHNITAAYSGTASYQASTSAAVQETVNPAPSATTLASSQNPAKWKSPVTFTATVTPGIQNLTLTGSVTFYFGSKVLGAVPLSGSLTASFTTSSLPVGSDTITAIYSGNASFASSQAQIVEQIRH